MSDKSFILFEQTSNQKPRGIRSIVRVVSQDDPSLTFSFEGYVDQDGKKITCAHPAIDVPQWVKYGDTLTTEVIQ